MSFANPAAKVAIIGAGYVGASIAYAMMLRELTQNLILIDTDIVKAKGEVLDIRHGIPAVGKASIYAGTYSDCRDCDLIIIAAGRNRRHGETRHDLAKGNVEILRSVVNELMRHYTRGAILIISNPVDVLVYCCESWMHLPNGRIFGSGCMLDTSRLIVMLSDILQADISDIHAMAAGGHGELMFPMWSRTSVAGRSIDEYCESMGINWNTTHRNEITEKVKEMGTQIIMSKKRTHYGIASCVCHLTDCIINQRETIAPVSSVLTGEYGIEHVALSVPCIITPEGVSGRLADPLSDEELSKLRQAADVLNKIISMIRL